MRLRPFAAATAMLAFSLAARADSIIDQQNSFYNSTFSGSRMAGQSFTPTLNGIDFAAFRLQSDNTSSVAIRLFQGGGFGGTLLATSSAETVSALGDYSFLFTSTVPLVSGSMYTLQLFVLSGGAITETESSGNRYAGGTEYSSGGVAQTGYDLTFREGLNSTVTPEPSSLALLGTGALGLIGAARRRFAA